MIRGVDANLLGRNLRLIRDSSDKLVWPWLKKNPTRKDANRFLLWASMNYHMPVAMVMEKAKLVLELVDDPHSLWSRISKFDEETWMGLWTEHKTHRYSQGHRRLWRIARNIMATFKGDARKVWTDTATDEVLARLLKLGVGEQLSRMVIGALCDTENLTRASDVKVDRHVRRVLGRLARGQEFGEKEVDKVIELTREMAPDDPWSLDFALFNMGRTICGTKPQCEKCQMALCCSYKKENTTTPPMEVMR